tara:strand:+ start:1859 stop:4246 length:2388 start_codon:yes stop_codon:yes gene_type:complete
MVQSNSYAQINHQDAILTEEEKAWVDDHPVLRSTNEMEWAPLDFVRDGKALGFSVDYLNLVAKKVGLEIEYINGFAWSDLLRMLKNREIDIAQSIIMTPDRMEYLDFSEPYLDLPMVYFGREGADRINGLADLEGKKIGIVTGSVPATVYEDHFSYLNLVKFESTIQALKALSAGSIDVHPDILPVSRYMIRTTMLPGIEVIGDKFYPETENSDFIRLASRNDWPILSTILQKGMAAVTEEEFVALTDKWQTAQLESAEPDIGLTPEEVAWLAENNVFDVAVDPDVEPLEFIDENGEISGFTGDYLRKIANKLKVKFNPVRSESWTDSLDKARNKEVALLGLVTPTVQRGEFFSFTDSYMDVVNMIFARQGEGAFGTLEGLVGKKVVLVKGYSAIDYIAKNYPQIKLVTTETIADALRLVASGDAQAYVGNLQMVIHTVAEERLSNIVVVGNTPYRQINTFGVRSDLPLLASAMQKALQSITEQERAEITRTWTGLITEVPADYARVWQLSIAGLVLLILILIWNTSLRREVERRKVVERKLIISQERAQRAQSEAEAANAAKSAFLANMSHEIRTPLNAIIGFSDAMLAGVGGTIKEKKHTEYLTDIRNSGEHLATVINDILDLSKIEAGKWKLDEYDFDLEACLQDAIKMLLPQADHKKISICYHPDENIVPENIHGDINAIKRIFINLLSNSIKYTSAGGKIECHINKQRNGSVEIEISDNGIGIPTDRIDHVLSPFEQIHKEHDLNEEGTGLGLPIVKNLVELHGGKFKLISEVNKGTTAVISIPSRRVSG